jgi:3',5'-cyclic-AMP phosphodiesterase
MPVHLSPLNRRQFLARALATGAALAAGRSFAADAKPVDADLFALLSDTHIPASPDVESRGVNMTANLVEAGKQVVGLAKRPAAALINGDCAYLDGKPEDYMNLVKLLGPIRAAGLPVHMTLGNHDHRENFRSGVAEAKEGSGSVPDKHAVILRSPRANWFLLDSLEAVNKTPGSLGEAQLQWLAKSLDEHKDKPAILFAHHNLHLVEGENRSGLKDTEKLLEIARPRKHVKAYIFGHTHRWEVKTDESGLHLINLPPVAYVFDKVRPSGWVEAQLKADGLRLQLHALDAKHPEAGQVKELAWRAA